MEASGLVISRELTSNRILTPEREKAAEEKCHAADIKRKINCTMSLASDSE
jgi:hypothetical protein